MLHTILFVVALLAVTASACLVALPMARVRMRAGGFGIYPGDLRDVGLALSMVLVLVPTVIVARDGSVNEILFALFAVALHGVLLNTFRVKTPEEAKAVEAEAAGASIGPATGSSDVAHGEPRDC